MARLSTHVLDTARGTPAGGLRVELYRQIGARRELVCAAETNADGRTSEPLMSGERLEPGLYELDFAAGPYLRQHHSSLPDPLFFDRITIRFGIADSAGHYHVPLLLSPFGYSTYRGS